MLIVANVHISAVVTVKDAVESASQTLIYAVVVHVESAFEYI